MSKFKDLVFLFLTFLVLAGRFNESPTNKVIWKWSKYVLTGLGSGFLVVVKTDNTAYQALVLVWLGCGKKSERAGPHPIGQKGQLVKRSLNPKS